MVVFTCNACGDILKKNQVDQHFHRCRNCKSLSCIDCGKDFWGNEYEQHVKCITEEEKYSGKNFVPKPGSNKNELKQQQWIKEVQDAIDKASANVRLRGVLERLKEYPNIPRKQNKFINFLSNSVNLRDKNLCNQVWQILMANKEPVKQPTVELKNTDTDDKEIKVPNDTNHSINNVGGEDSVALSKRQRKEERRKKSHKAEKKDKVKEEEVVENGIIDRPLKKKKRKLDNSEVTEEENTVNTAENGCTEKELKRKKQKLSEEEDTSALAADTNLCDVKEGSNNDKKTFKTKFNWTEVIVEVLESKGPELKINKLKKKVLAEYLSRGCTEYSEERLWARFEKKLKKIPNVKCVNNRAKLVI